ncbi:MAG TPA: hypothetical protein VNH18_03375, partial [Bryobacteraceae bacterium]|nr:hypothetical protein [Bryobacteraceae bacterium]
RSRTGPVCLTQCHGLTLAAAVTDSIIGIPLKQHAGKLPSHPHVERVMQEKVSQQRADDSPNAKGNFEFERRVRFLRKSRTD